MSHANIEDIKKHVRVYIGVFIALGVLTIVTVGVSYIHLPIGPAIALAMVVAMIKGTLVAGYFMHLFDERKTIYVTLALCVVLFVVLMIVPIITVHDNREIKQPHAAPPAAAAQH